MLNNISKSEFLLLLKQWNSKLWYYDDLVINAAELIAIEKGYKVLYYKFEQAGCVHALFPLRYKERRLFFKYGEYLISKDLGIDNIELLVNWNLARIEIFYELEKVFSKLSFNVLKFNSIFSDLRYKLFERKILYLDIPNRKSNYSKNFSQNIRTAKNRLEKSTKFTYHFNDSEQDGFMTIFNSFAIAHFKNKLHSTWLEPFYRLIFQSRKRLATTLSARFVICELAINEEKVAGIFGWIDNGVFYFNQSYYKDEFATYSPVILVIEYCCEQLNKLFDVKTFDFMRGTEDYKSRFAKDFYAVQSFELTSPVYANLLKFKSRIMDS